MEEEVWKPITGLEERYEVSSHGRVRSLERRFKNSVGYNRVIKGKLCCQQQCRNGYWRVNISPYFKVWRKYLVHRLVGMAFVEGYKEGLEINHIDEDKNNNYYKNLEWVTREYNMKLANESKRTSK